MKNILNTLLLLCLALTSSAQQQSSKSKSSDKLYDKGDRHVTVRNAEGVNSDELEFSPAFYQNGIVIVSSRYKAGPVDKNTGGTFFELFYAEFDEEGLPQSPQPFSLSVNSQVHEGPVSFSRSNDLMYFTRNNLEKGVAKANKNHKVGLKIYEATRGKLDWQDVKEMPFNSNDYNCVHPALSADGKRLFFSSSMPGGYGGMDLYFVEKRADTWSKPVNLGPEVNTAEDELFPYLHESGSLFFSSNGWGGEGDLDIFQIDVDGKQWGKLNNLGAPFNSPKDDLGFIINEAGTRGYFASDREGGSGKDDIYVFDVDISLIEGEMPSLHSMVVAYDERNNERLSGAEVRIFERSVEGFLEGKDLYDMEFIPSDGDDLVMKLVRKNAESLGEAALTTNLNGEAVCEMKPGKNYIILVSKEGYESGEKVLSIAATEKKGETIHIPLKSKNCTTLAGVVSVEGYGTRAPNALVRIVDEANGTEELLRSNAKGEFSACLPAGQRYVVHAEKEGYQKGMTHLSTPETTAAQPLNVTVKLKANEEKVVKEPIREGSVIVLEKIYYDFNRYFIRKGAARELDGIAQLMRQYPSMEIELNAHTDSRGTEEYNKELSLQRAESAMRYLELQGISRSRIRAFGSGESEIRNHCTEGVECTDEEHQFNRRTEVKVTRIEEQVKVQYGEGDPAGNK